MNAVRVRDVMPPARADRLLQAGYDRSNAQWVIGDETLDQVEEISGTHPEIGVMEVYEYVAQLTGCSGRSIRRYAATSKFFADGEARKRYDTLHFEYFARAAAYRLEAYEFLELALRMADRLGGRLPGVDRVEREFDRKSLVGGEPDYPEQEGEYWENEAGLVEEDAPPPSFGDNDDDDEGLDEAEREIRDGVTEAGAIYRAIARAAGVLLDALRLLPVPEEVRERLVGKAEELVAEVMEARDLAGG
jgi:hypothetical protein